MKNLIKILFVVSILTFTLSGSTNTLLVNKAKYITQNFIDKQTKCIKIAEWISGNIANHGVCYSGNTTCKNFND